MIIHLRRSAYQDYADVATALDQAEPRLLEALNRLYALACEAEDAAEAARREYAREPEINPDR
jgi:hypothetical protein